MKEAFSTIATFQYSAEAQIVKGRLEADGINAFLADNHTIDTDPLVSNAIGGVKLRVNSEDEKQALDVLSSIEKFSLSDNGERILCPRCGSEKVELSSHIKGVKSSFFFLFSFLTTALPLFVKYDYRCGNCKNKFRLNER